MNEESRQENHASEEFIAQLSDEEARVHELAYLAGSFAWKWVYAEIQKQEILDSSLLIARGYIRQVERTREIENLDPLTGLYNKTGFRKLVVDNFETAHRARELDSTHSLLVLDLDDFKRVNDTIGHHETDETCLLPVAEIIRESIRSDDFGARWGGEEFAILLRNADERAAFTKAAEIQEKINRIVPGAAYGKPLGNLGVCVGIASYPQGSDYERVFMRADEALRQAKRVPGKNQIEHFANTGS